MRKITLLIIISILALYILPVYAESTEPEIHSPSAILVDSKTGTILYEKNIHQKMYPASITKIMTAIIALENSNNLQEMVTASTQAVTSISLDSSHIGILPNEELTLEQLLYGLLVASANEAANVIAEHIAGNNDEFLKLMNEKAKALGANNTHFTNTNGLHDENHYTTAYDMALISKHAMTIPKFREIVNTYYYEIGPTNKRDEIRYLASTNHLINKARATSSYNFFYSPAIGIKTGWTSKADHTLVAAAKNNELELITVVLGAKKEGNNYYSYSDTIDLFEYGFNQFGMQTIVQPGEIIDESEVLEAKNKEYVTLLAEEPLQALLPNNLDTSKLETKVYVNTPLKAPVEKGQVLGFVSYKYAGQDIGKLNLIADKSIEREPLSIVKEKTVSILTSLWFKVGVAVVIVILLLLLILKIRTKKRTSYNNRYMFKGKKIKIKYVGRRKKW